jgi:hypothetical protein
METIDDIENSFIEKRKKVKKQKRELDDINFRSSKERKKVRDGINREYRSYKRSEKQAVSKYIQDQIEKEKTD